MCCLVAPSPSLPALSFSLCTTSVCYMCGWLGTANAAPPVWQLSCNPISCYLLRCCSSCTPPALFLSVVRVPIWAGTSAALPGVGQRLTAALSVHLCHFAPLSKWLLAATGAQSSSMEAVVLLLLLTIMWSGLRAMQGLTRETDSVIKGASSVKLRMLWCEKTEDCWNVFQRWGFTGKPLLCPMIPIQSPTTMNDLEWPKM